MLSVHSNTCIKLWKKKKKKMEKAPERITKTKPFIAKQTSIIKKRINFLSGKDDSKTFEKKKIKNCF